MDNSVSYPPPYAALLSTDLVEVGRAQGPNGVSALGFQPLSKLLTVVPDGIQAFSAGTNSQTNGTIVFSNSNNVSFGLNTNGAVTASVAPGEGFTHSFYEPNAFAAGSAYSSFGVGTIYFDPMELDANISFSAINQLASFNMNGVSSNPGTSGQVGFTNAFAVYSRSQPGGAGSTNLVQFMSDIQTISAGWSASSSSISMSYGWGTGTTNGSSSASFSTSAAALTNASFTGQKVNSIGFASSIAPGDYWIAQSVSSSSAGGASASAIFSISHAVLTAATNGSWAAGFGQASATNAQPVLGLGVFSVTSAAFPTSVGLNAISVQSINRRYYNFQA